MSALDKEDEERELAARRAQPPSELPRRMSSSTGRRRWVAPAATTRWTQVHRARIATPKPPRDCFLEGVDADGAAAPSPPEPTGRPGRLRAAGSRGVQRVRAGANARGGRAEQSARPPRRRARALPVGRRADQPRLQPYQETVAFLCRRRASPTRGCSSCTARARGRRRR